MGEMGNVRCDIWEKWVGGRKTITLVASCVIERPSLKLILP